MFTCKSLSRDTMWYEVSSKDWSMNDLNLSGTSASFADNIYEWSDMGHDGVQHEGRRPVNLEHAADCMASLAKKIIDEPAVLENECIALFFPDAPERKAVLFLAALRKTDKDRYYSPGLLKTSGDTEKRFDKRYFKVDDSCDGSLDFVAATLSNAVMKTALGRMAMTMWAAEIMDTCAPQTPFKSMPYDKWSALRSTFRLLDLAIKARRASVSARSSMECHIRNLENQKRWAMEEVNKKEEEVSA